MAWEARLRRGGRQAGALAGVRSRTNAALLEGKRGDFNDLAANDHRNPTLAPSSVITAGRALHRREPGDPGQAVVQRRCRVFKAAVSDVSGKEIEFTTPCRRLLGGCDGRHHEQHDGQPGAEAVL